MTPSPPVLPALAVAVGVSLAALYGIYRRRANDA